MVLTVVNEPLPREIQRGGLAPLFGILSMVCPTLRLFRVAQSNGRGNWFWNATQSGRRQVMIPVQSYWKVVRLSDPTGLKRKADEDYVILTSKALFGPII